MAIGVNVREVDNSLYTNVSSTSPVLAVVGAATMGEVGVPTLCTSLKDFRSKFGTLNPECLATYAAEWYLKKVSRVYFVRAAGTSAAPAKVTFPGTKVVEEESTTVDSVFSIESKDIGTLYNGYTAVIANYSTEDKTFDLTIKLDDDTTPVVKLVGVTLDSTVENYVGAKLTSTVFRLTTIDDAQSDLTDGEYTVAGGDNGLEEIDSSIVECLESLKSNNYSIDLLSIPDSRSAAVVQAGLAACEYRGDTLYLVDTPPHIDYQDAKRWVNGAGEYDDHAAFNSSYGACYYAWQYVYDSVNSENVLVPPSVPVAVAIANSELMTHAWFAPAGLSRGVLSNTVSSEYKPTDVEVDEMYEANINSIITHETAGLVIWGQKTLLRKDTSLDRVNVRRLMTYIKRIVRRTCQFFTFEPNDSTTWAQFEDLLTPVFRSLVENRGIYDFKIVPMEDTVTDEDIDNSTMPAQILIKPTKSAEYIPVDIVLTSTGVEL